ncbi:DUF91 domain-containing protein [Deinococcus irradiatisoli]|uniref:DUF91 domain-containing protein n=1 Tax=Deinococcus irradiatisoli TaxID=2202254 RepID=A0A2Z3JNA8_9DEIO|nr:endonuclease NucS domain-containing protein [Deinococcus irradiatisoli]AWN24269.1 DUF91 domain-containing protein [Deinococcus irradiatisoli]
MTNYYKVMLGRGSLYAAQAIAGGFIGIEDTMGLDLTPYLSLPEADFRQQVKTALSASNPQLTRATISQYATTLWRIAQGIELGDVVLSPDGLPGPGQLRVADVSGPYHYEAGAPLPHRREVVWRPNPVLRSSMSQPLKNSSGGVTTIIDLTPYEAELVALTTPSTSVPAPVVPASVTGPGTAVETLLAFTLEKQLEDFLVANWASTELGKDYEIYVNDNGDPVGQQFQTDTGPLDILALKKDKTEWLVVELKRGRASDVVVGQIQRYMGYVLQEMTENGQRVRGVIIALEDDLRIRRALAVTPDIRFYRYKIDFKLLPIAGMGA